MFKLHKLTLVCATVKVPQTHCVVLTLKEMDAHGSFLNVKCGLNLTNCKGCCLSHPTSLARVAGNYFTQLKVPMLIVVGTENSWNVESYRFWYFQTYKKSSFMVLMVTS